MGEPAAPTKPSRKDHLARTPSAMSHISKVSKVSRVGGYDDEADNEEAGVITDEHGGTRFRFRRNSIYDPPLAPILQGEGGDSSTRRKSLAMRLSFGSGIAGPLIAGHFLSDETESLASFEGSEEAVGGGGGAEGVKKRRSKKKIKLFGCIGVIIGCVLGSGIFAAPQAILEFTDSAGMTLLVWFTYGMIALVGALCYVELGCTIPVSGGDYAYLNECFGPLAAFLFQWAANFVIIPTVIAIMASVVAKNLIDPYVDDPNSKAVEWATCCIAIMLICLVIYINYVSSELTEKIQGWLMIINIVTICLIIICGIVHMSRFGIENRSNFTIALPHDKAHPEESDQTKFVLLQLIMALYQASFSYFGYSYVTYIMEDVDNPLRTVPLAIFISIPIVIVLNVFVNFCYLGSIPLADLKQTNTVASEMMKSLYKKREEFPKSLIWIGPTLVAIAVMGGLLSNVLTCSRVSFIGARNRHFPGIFKMTHFQKITPVVSLVFMGLVGCTYALLDITMLIGILTYVMSTVNCGVMYGLIHLRIKKPDMPRPFKLPLIVPIAYSAVVTFLFVTPILLLDGKSYKKTLPSLAGAISVVFAGIPIYYLFVVEGKGFRLFDMMHGKLKKFLQKIWLILPEEELLEGADEEKLEIRSNFSQSSSIDE